MPFLLLVFLMLACLPDVGGSAWPHLPGFDTLWCSTLSWLAVAGTVGWAFGIARHVRRSLAQDPSQREILLNRYERQRFAHQMGLFGMYILVMCLLGWGWAVGQFWTRVDGTTPTGLPHYTPLPGAELLVLAPFLSAMVLSWVVFYDADKAAYLAVHPPLALDPLARAFLDQDGSRSLAADLAAVGHPLARAFLDQDGSAALPLPAAPPGRTTEPFGGRWNYVLTRVRQNLLMVFIPILLLLGQKEIRRLFPEQAPDWDTMLTLGGFVVVLAVFVFMPWIVRLVLGLKPLPDGPLRRRLLATARRLRFRCSDVLLWNTHGGMANAMVVGILPWPRYVVFTDKLIDEFFPEEVQAVFGHEVGHIKHRHMFYYLAFLSISILVLVLLLTTWMPSLVSGLAEGDAAETAAVHDDFFDLSNHQYLRAVPMMGLSLVYLFVVFGFLSRRCERQADIYGCRAVSCPDPNCPDHSACLERATYAAVLCPTGIRTFIRALEKVALVNGISRDRPGFLQSWQHSTIARRVDFLQTMLGDPKVERHFQRRVLLVKWGMLVVLGLMLGGLLLTAWLKQLPAT